GGRGGSAAPSQRCPNSKGAVAMKRFRPDYDQLTPEERVHLLLAAAVRGDADEAARLGQSCPLVKAMVGDPAYPELLDRTKHAGMEALFQWLDVSHRVARASSNTVNLQRI